MIEQKKRASVSSLSTTRQLAFVHTGDLTFRHHQLDMFYNDQGSSLFHRFVLKIYACQFKE